MFWSLQVCRRSTKLNLRQLPFQSSCVHNFSTFDNKKAFSSKQNLLCNGRKSSIIQSRQFSLNSTITNLWLTISNSTPVAHFQQGLIQLHDVTGLPWWGTVILSTVLLRTVITLPLTIYQQKISARIELIMLEMPDIANELKRETDVAVRKFKWSEREAKLRYKQSLKQQWTKLIERDNCHPLKTLIVLWGQIPLWIIQSVSIRNLLNNLPNPGSLQAQIVFAELSLGGFGWVPNLTEIDASYILPITLGILNLTIIEIQLMSKVRKSSKFQNVATWFFRALSIAMVPIAANVPACLSLYWATSSAYGLGQNLLLMSPKVRRFTGIPKTDSELQHPYKHVAEQFVLRIRGAEKKLFNRIK